MALNPQIEQTWKELLERAEQELDPDSEAFEKNMEAVSRLRVNDEELEQRKASVWEGVKNRIIAAEQAAERRSRKQFTKRIVIFLLATALLTVWATANAPKLFQHMFGTETITVDGVSGSVTTDNALSEYASMRIALQEYGMEAVAPSWIPGRFSLETVNVQLLNENANIVAWYEAKDGTGFSVVVYYTQSNDTSALQAQFETNGKYDAKSIGNNTYYFTKNLDLLVVYWTYQNCLCSISGDLSQDEAKKIITSLGEVIET